MKTAKCLVEGPYCEGEAITDIPVPVCDNCFAYQGFARIKPVTGWRKAWKRIRLFSSIVFRESPNTGRMRIGISWEVARIIWP